jgi:hypothetical protein
LAAACGPGCETLSGVRAPAPAAAPDPAAAGADPSGRTVQAVGAWRSAGGPVVAAGGPAAVGADGTPLPKIPQLPDAGGAVAPMSPPRQPTLPSQPPPGQLPQGQALAAPRSVQPGDCPPGGAGRGGPPGTAGAYDPHQRTTPTVTGARLELAPWEAPADRVVDLTRQIDIAQAQNRDLLARIKELEVLGREREQAVAEAAREIDALAPDAARARALQVQVAQLQARIGQLEAEDVALLKKVIELLQKLIGPGGP